MRVLTLVTNVDSQFYNTQLSVLANHGVDSTTLAVPGHHEYAVDDQPDAVEEVFVAGERSDDRDAIGQLSTERMGKRIRGVYEDVLES
jgi:hypothetical protein